MQAQLQNFLSYLEHLFSAFLIMLQISLSLWWSFCQFVHYEDIRGIVMPIHKDSLCTLLLKLAATDRLRHRQRQTDRQIHHAERQRQTDRQTDKYTILDQTRRSVPTWCLYLHYISWHAFEISGRVSSVNFYFPWQLSNVSTFCQNIHEPETQAVGGINDLQ
jgi:hypothetical protein